MHPEEIKINVQREYAQLKSSRERIEELQNICKHERTNHRDYTWRPGSTVPVEMCEFCDKIIKMLPQ